MKFEMGCILLSFLLSSCAGMSAFVITPTTTPTAKMLAPSPTPHTTNYPTVQVNGDVYVRDDQGKVIGWLYKGDQVQAKCLGEWCTISSGSFSGYQFWRGCSSSNPEHRNCQAK